LSGGVEGARADGYSVNLFARITADGLETDPFVDDSIPAADVMVDGSGFTMDALFAGPCDVVEMWPVMVKVSPIDVVIIVIAVAEAEADADDAEPER